MRLQHHTQFFTNFTSHAGTIYLGMGQNFTLGWAKI